MGQTFYPQSDDPADTLTVGRLIERLRALDSNASVIFRAPRYGCFGPGERYSVDAVTQERLERREEHYPASSYEDDETGETITTEAYTQVFPAWAGVVIS